MRQEIGVDGIEFALYTGTATVTDGVRHMFRFAEPYLLIAIAVLASPSSASATIFEMTRSFSSATAVSPSFYRPDSQMKGLYQTASTSRGTGLPAPSGKLGMVSPEDLLWVAIGDTGYSGFQTLSSSADSALHLAEAGHIGAAGAPAAQGASSEIWALFLIGAGLIWSQLRRKSRHGAIRFTAP